MGRLYETLVRGALVLDGAGSEPKTLDVAVEGGRIVAIAPAGSIEPTKADQVWEARGLALSPGFIDVHAHDDVALISAPEMTPKISQGVTTVVVGNCGISAAPVALNGDPPDPMSLLGRADDFVYPTFAAYVEAVTAARPSVNVAAFVGHTSLRSNHLDRLDRAALPREIERMRAELADALAHGALGLSTGLAYRNAKAAPTEEITALAEPLAEAGGLYATHLRTESDGILDAMDEAYDIGRRARVPVLVAHLKCAGPNNHGRSSEILQSLERAARDQPVGWDCYPYTASSSTLDVTPGVNDKIEIMITWSDPHPEMGGLSLAAIASAWKVDLLEAARRLQPAGAVYHSMAADDVERFLGHPDTAIGSDGLPMDPRPHPRLWGTFPRVLGHYARERKLFSLSEAVRKMTGLSADRYRISHRGFLKTGYWADLVLFDPSSIRDVATFASPTEPAEGIAAVWVNGMLSWQGRSGAPDASRPAIARGRAGRFLPRRGDETP